MDQKVSPAAVEPPPRLDLFAFPSETRGRYRMLVITALLLGLHLATTIWEVATDETEQVRLQEVMRNFTPDGRRLEGRSAAPAESLNRQFYHGLLCAIAATLMPRSMNLAGHLGFLIAAAAIFYRTHPWRLRRAQKPLPLGPSEAPSVIGYLRRCAEALGIPHLRIEHRGERIGGGLSYGPKNQEVLLLHGPPARLESSWETFTKAIALHELAHVVHGDAPDREKARAVWHALLLHGALILGAALLIASGMWGAIHETRAWPPVSKLLTTGVGAVFLYLPFIAMLLLVRMIWAGLVRSREFSADWRASSWGVGAMLDHILRARQPSEAGGLIGRWWRLLWRLHPSHGERRQILSDPRRLFRVSPDLAFGTGLLLSLAVIYSLHLMLQLGFLVAALLSSFWVALALPDNPYIVRLELLAIVVLMLLLIAAALFILSYLVTSTLGVQVQREAVADLAQGERGRHGYIRLLAPACLVVAGMEVGILIAPYSPFSSVLARPTTAPLWLLGLTLLGWLWLVYIRAATRLSLGVQAGKKPPHRQRTRILLSAVLLLNVLFWPAVITRLTFRMTEETPHVPPEVVIGNAQRAFFLTLFASLVYLLWSGAGLLRAARRLWSRRLRCPACGQEVRHGFTLGKSCVGCGEELTPWVFAGPPHEPGRPEATSARTPENRGAPDARQSKREAWSELGSLALGWAGIVFILASGLYADSLFVRWTREGAIPIGLITPGIGLALPGVVLLAGAWALRFLVDDRSSRCGSDVS